VRTSTTRHYQDTQVDVKLVLCALWIAVLFVFAYVDIFGFFRASIVEAVLLAAIARSAWKWPPPQSAPSV
jgi:hypothetical protein